MKFINPYRITGIDLPLIALSTDASGIMQSLIRIRTKGSYSHIMTMIEPGSFASQGNIFSLATVDRYMTANCRLKFWRIKDLTNDERVLIKRRINARLNRPWIGRQYDYLGVIGQFLGLKWINNPFVPYCSEQVRIDVLEGIIDGIQEHPSPQDLNEAFKNHPRMEVYGRWWSD